MNKQICRLSNKFILTNRCNRNNFLGNIFFFTAHSPRARQAESSTVVFLPLRSTCGLPGRDPLCPLAAGPFPPLGEAQSSHDLSAVRSASESAPVCLPKNRRPIEIHRFPIILARPARGRRASAGQYRVGGRSSLFSSAFLRSRVNLENRRRPVAETKVEEAGRLVEGIVESARGETNETRSAARRN